MRFWEGGAVTSLLFLAALLVVAVAIRRIVAPVRKMAIPDSVTAGTLGFIFGPSILGIIPLDQAVLETLVYHGLALVFICVALQAPAKARATDGAWSMAIGIPTLALLQGFVGLLVVLIWCTVTNDPQALHPGFGFLVPLGFSQGPGQALSIGTQWEAEGLVSGGQIGLIFAACGFAWCCMIGVPLVEIAKWRGWAKDPGRSGGQDEEHVPADRPQPGTPPPGAQEPLTWQIVSIGTVYLLTFGALTLLNDLLANAPKIQNLIWGFHFIFASLLAMTCRKMVGVLKIPNRLNDNLLGRIAGLVVDFTTAAALCAVQMPVLEKFFVPIMTFTVVGGTLTLIICLWLAKRAFPSAPFEHALVLFGTSTGTMPTGLTLLRILDPDLKGPVATSTVLGATGAIMLGAPLLIVIMPLPVVGWPETYPMGIYKALGLMVVYGVALFVIWRKVGPLRFGKLAKLWPTGSGNK